MLLPLPLYRTLLLQMLLLLCLSLLPLLPQGVLMALGATCPHMLLRDTWRLEDFALLKQVYKVGTSTGAGVLILKTVHVGLCRRTVP